MKILIVGGRGMLGTDLMEAFSSVHDTTGMDLPELDITQLEQCHAKLKEFRPDVVINAAAFTQVDACESREKEAFLVNGHGAGNLAIAAASSGAMLVHYSTDYIFDGQKEAAYVEEDLPNPQNVYGKSKLLGETLIRRALPESFDSAHFLALWPERKQFYPHYRECRQKRESPACRQRSEGQPLVFQGSCRAHAEDDRSGLPVHLSRYKQRVLHLV